MIHGFKPSPRDENFCIWPYLYTITDYIVWPIIIIAYSKYETIFSFLDHARSRARDRNFRKLQSYAFISSVKGLICQNCRSQQPGACACKMYCEAVIQFLAILRQLARMSVLGSVYLTTIADYLSVCGSRKTPSRPSPCLCQSIFDVTL